MIMAQEQSILKAKDEFDQMVAAIGKAAAEGSIWWSVISGTGCWRYRV